MGNPEGIPIPPLPVGATAPQPHIVRRPINTTNHFFHFDGEDLFRPSATKLGRPYGVMYVSSS